MDQTSDAGQRSHADDGGTGQTTDHIHLPTGFVVRLDYFRLSFMLD